jgi:hypothetical protein
VNDIAAAKAYLDRKNDAGECNSANLVVIGADTGATLAAVWINAEWHRFLFHPGTLFGMGPTIANASEGENILCGIFLDINPSLGGRTIPLTSVLDFPGRVKKMPFLFLHGGDNDSSKRVSQGLDKHMKYKQKLSYTGAVAVPDSGELEGAALLQPSLPTIASIAEYGKSLLDERAQDWLERDFRDSLYVWRVPRANYQQSAANTKGERNLHFNSYEGFIPLR